MTQISIKSVSVDTPQGNASGYEYTVVEDDKVVSHGIAPTVLEAAMFAGNDTYDAWGYHVSMGRLKIEKPEGWR